MEMYQKNTFDNKLIPFNIRLDEVRRGDVLKVQLEETAPKGEQCGDRYAVVIQNDLGNRASGTTIVAFFTSKIKNSLPVHMDVKILTDSTLMLEQIRTISKERIEYIVGHLSRDEMREMDTKLMKSIGLMWID